VAESFDALEDRLETPLELAGVVVARCSELFDPRSVTRWLGSPSLQPRPVLGLLPLGGVLDTPTDLRRARRLAGLAGGLLVAFLIGFFGHFILDMGGLKRVSHAVRTLLWLPMASLVLTAGLAFTVTRLWRTGQGATLGRVYYAGITLALLAFIPFLHHLRLLGFPTSQSAPAHRAPEPFEPGRRGLRTSANTAVSRG
jgi:hypothetical protein